MASGPLSGVKVLEFSQVIAGPFCGMHLADMGAEVTKFEPIAGEPWRLMVELVPKESRVFASLNRGKTGRGHGHGATRGPGRHPLAGEGQRRGHHQLSSGGCRTTRH
ncbi:MAG: CoA transferase [Dehalococcoidia bacterium]|nr:CoA transferase [Dehalococcoidia bacterium]